MDQSVLITPDDAVTPKPSKFKIHRFDGINKTTKRIKELLWIYFLLLVLEGALRKWVLPGLATPLLLARDPIAIWLIILALREGILKNNIYVTGLFLISIFGLFAAMLGGHGNFVVAIYGVRTLALHFPVIFIMGSVFTRDDVLKVGLITLWLSLPITILLILQFYSPQEALVNRGVGGDVVQGFQGALGFFRPSATFSFTNGTALFYSFDACFVFYFWLTSNKGVNKILLIAASVAVAMSIPFSISRSLLFFILVTVGFIVIGTARTPRAMFRIILIGIAIVGLFAALSQVGIFATAAEALTSRFSQASESEGGLEGTLGNRYLGGLLNVFSQQQDVPLFGNGIGLGTNVGAQLLTGKVEFIVSEGEWGRLLGELGMPLGLLVIFMRLALCVRLFLSAYKKLDFNDFLPWILVSYALLTMPQGQWSQPTSLGFSIIACGVTLASLNQNKNTRKLTVAPQKSKSLKNLINQS